MTSMTLLIRNYNRSQYLEKLYNSLIKSDLKKSNTRIIYDDCSNDKNTEILLN